VSTHEPTDRVDAADTTRRRAATRHDTAGRPTLLLGHGSIASDTALLLRLQRAAGNARVQRALALLGRDVDPGTAPTTAPAATVAPTTAAVVGDATQELAPGQMRRTAFLAALRAELDGAVASADALAQADARVTLPGAFAELESQDTAGLERSVLAQLPGVEPGDARRYVTAAGVAARAQLAGAPAPAQGIVGRALAAAGALVSALFKAREGRSTPADARVVRHSLGAGHPLDAGLRHPMERAYGRSFADVRVHTDVAAGTMSEQLGARAFTVGDDIAFSPGEYQPASPVGSALVAHELAHVGQHGGGTDAPSIAGLEEDADRSAVGAVVSLWAGDAGGAQLDGVMPRLRAGLRLQRCAGGSAQGRGTVAPAPTTTPLTPEQWHAAVVAAQGQTGPAQAAAMTMLVQNALAVLGLTVRTAGSAHADVDPADYAPIPVVNVDVRLNQKRRWISPDRRRAGEVPEPVGANYGYNFRAGSDRYVVLGPNALNADSPLWTRQCAQHELELVSMERAGRSKAELELLVWTEDFRRYFHQDLAEGRVRHWNPMRGYYDQSGPAVRQQSIGRLVEYFTTPPSGADAEAVRRAVRAWVRRHQSSAMATDLGAALPGAP